MEDLNNITNKIKIKLFVSFLKRKRILNNFISYFNSEQGLQFRNDEKTEQNLADYTLTHAFDRLINNAFSWDNTIEGFGYYAKLDKELRDYYKHLTQKNILNDIRKIGWKSINEV